VFGGTGMNFVNPALVARAFLFFAYPAEISGDAVWTAIPPEAAVDGFSGATVLARIRLLAAPFADQPYSWWQAFPGFEPGSMGETSALACLIGAAILVVTGIGSWRTMAAVTLGTAATATIFNLIGSSTSAWFAVPFWWHMVAGGWAFGMVFMATDPVTAAMTDAGRWVYGLLIGGMVVLVRVANPAFPEGMMLAILFANVFAPLIDYVVVRIHVRARSRRLV
jgi:Na+-transporting NADH:ubiquinone oxidoreductase subunit B